MSSQYQFCLRLAPQENSRPSLSPDPNRVYAFNRFACSEKPICTNTAHVQERGGGKGEK
jgi:hypothetical protein